MKDKGRDLTRVRKTGVIFSSEQAPDLLTKREQVLIFIRKKILRK